MGPDNKFVQKIAEWKDLARRDETFAKKYYFDNLFTQLVVPNFLERGKNVESEFDYLISIIGFSAPPIILFLNIIKPSRCFFICSEETEKTLDDVFEHYPLKPSEYEKYTIDSMDITTLYGTIKKIVKDREHNKILIDITGGKKVMSGGASLAAGYLGIKAAYVNYTTYYKELRQPEPGTEFPTILENPIRILGELEVNKAIGFFNNFNFTRSIEILEHLEARIKDVWKARKYLYLSKAYSKWHEFFIEDALSKIGKILENNSETSLNLDTDLLKCLELHRQTLKKISSLDAYKILNFYFSAERYFRIKRYDIATFLMYRVIEKTIQTRLKEEYGFSVSSPDYKKLAVTEEAYKKKSKEVFGEDYRESELPTKVALMDGTVLLSILNDPVTEELNLRDLRGVLQLRNESVYAHGEVPLKETDADRLRRQSRKLAEKYLKHNGMKNIESYRKEFEFPRLKEV